VLESAVSAISPSRGRAPESTPPAAARAHTEELRAEAAPVRAGGPPLLSVPSRANATLCFIQARGLPASLATREGQGGAGRPAAHHRSPATGGGSQREPLLVCPVSVTPFPTLWSPSQCQGSPTQNHTSPDLQEVGRRLRKQRSRRARLQGPPPQWPPPAPGHR